MTRPHISRRRARLFLLAILLTLGLVRSTNRAQRRLARRAAVDQALIGARARPVRVAPAHRPAVRDGDGAGGQQRFVTRVPPPPCATGFTLAEPNGSGSCSAPRRIRLRNVADRAVRRGSPLPGARVARGEQARTKEV